jgi:hypothetical protein
MAIRKSEVYSWRLAPDLKSQLEERAREEGIGLAALLDRISREWLRATSAASSDEEREQARLRAAVMLAIGTIEGDDPARSDRVSERVRQRLAQKRAG